jgi:hypothetical protein
MEEMGISIEFRVSSTGCDPRRLELGQDRVVVFASLKFEMLQPSLQPVVGHDDITFKCDKTLRSSSLPKMLM